MQVTVLGPVDGRPPGWRPRWLRGWWGGAVVAVAVLTIVVLVLGLLGRLPGQGGTPSAAPSTSTTGSNQPTSGPTDRPSTGPVPAAPAVLAPVQATGTAPTSAGLERVLRPLLEQDALGGSVAAAVVDLATGRQVYGSQATRAATPASTTKLMTAAAALTVLGPSYRIATTVVAGGTAGQIILVGGGDATLATAPPAGFVPAPASVPELARLTAVALKARGLTSVKLGYDTSLFTGPTTAATWPSDYVETGIVSPVVSLMVDEGRVGLTAEGTAPRVADPALGAAKAFARQLARQGITVTGAPTHVVAPRSASTAPSPGASPTGPPAAGTTLATVRSPQLSDLLGWMLSTSDNDLAESVARLVALGAREPADFTGGAEAVTATVGSLGVPVTDVQLYDGSGLSPQTRIPAAVLGQVLAAAAAADHGPLRSMLTGLAVAGFTGSLEPPRFDSPTTTRAAGLVRGKTGTLTGVSAIAGTVDDVDGRVLGFVFLADHVPAGGTLGARDALDRLAAGVASCGCR